jgi:uncharacterized protein (TIGR02246 family)
MVSTRIAALACCALSLVACAPADESEEDVLAAIESFNRQYLQAINEGDIELLASLTTDDHMMISGGGEPVHGKQALIDAMTGAFARYDFNESWAPQETVVSGDIAYQRGTFAIVATPKAAGDEIRMDGNFMRIYRRQPDGAWFMTRDTHAGN